MIRSVVFDMDGLLIDSERLSMSCWKTAFAEAGLVFDEELILHCRGTGPQDMVPRFCARLSISPEDFEHLMRRKNQLMEQVSSREGYHPKVGVHTLLPWLRDNGYLLSLATSTGEERAAEKLKSIGAYGYFDRYVYGSMIARYKPDPDIFLKAIGLLGCAPGDCLILEDSPNGILAAHAAGAKPMMIPDLTRPDAALSVLLWAEGTTLLDVIPLLQADRAGKEA